LNSFDHHYRPLFTGVRCSIGGWNSPLQEKAASGQREMLMAISGKGEGKSKGTKETTRTARQRKAG